MAPVPPGDQTGIYYIIIAGLPWQCSWQKLKDFARNQQPDGTWIEVDHAFVYPDSTNGWVRVKGKTDFLKVLAHLNGGELDHRSLIADGRNETEIANLCDLGTTKPSSAHRSRNNSITTECTCSENSTWLSPACQKFTRQATQTYSEWSSQTQGNYSPVSPVYSAGPYYQPPAPVYEASQHTYAVRQHVEYVAFPSTQSGIVYAGSIAPTTPVYVPQQQPVYTCLPMALNTRLMSPPTTVRNVQQLPTNSPVKNTVNGPVVQTEARKVVIKGLPRDTNETALRSLIQHLSGSSSSLSSCHSGTVIQDLELARHTDGKLKGHAFVVFESHRVTKRFMAAIEGYKFQGRELRVSLAKEGVEPTETFHQQGYISPESSRRGSESPSMMHSSFDERQFPSALERSMTEYRDAQWASKESSKASSNGKEKVRERDGMSDNRGRKALIKSRDSKEPIIGTPPVVDGSGRRRC